MTAQQGQEAGNAAPLPPPPPVPVTGPAVGDVVAWRRQRGPTPARGYGIVQAVSGAKVVVAPLSGSTSHTLIRPLADVRVLLTRCQLVEGLDVELGGRPW